MLEREQHVMEMKCIRRRDKDRVDLGRGAQRLRGFEGVFDPELPRIRLRLGEVTPPKPNQPRLARICKCWN